MSVVLREMSRYDGKVDVVVGEDDVLSPEVPVTGPIHAGNKEHQA